jgi:hypothetical protein
MITKNTARISEAIASIAVWPITPTTTALIQEMVLEAVDLVARIASMEINSILDKMDLGAAEASAAVDLARISKMILEEVHLIMLDSAIPMASAVPVLGPTLTATMGLDPMDSIVKEEEDVAEEVEVIVEAEADLVIEEEVEAGTIILVICKFYILLSSF